MFFSPVIDITIYQHMRQYLYFCTSKRANADVFVLQMLNFAKFRTWHRRKSGTFVEKVTVMTLAARGAELLWYKRLSVFVLLCQ
jgi:hypothetical protein